MIQTVSKQEIQEQLEKDYNSVLELVDKLNQDNFYDNISTASDKLDLIKSKLLLKQNYSLLKGLILKFENKLLKENITYKFDCYSSLINRFIKIAPDKDILEVANIIQKKHFDSDSDYSFFYWKLLENKDLEDEWNEYMSHTLTCKIQDTQEDLKRLETQLEHMNGNPKGLPVFGWYTDPAMIEQHIQYHKELIENTQRVLDSKDYSLNSPIDKRAIIAQNDNLFYSKLYSIVIGLDNRNMQSELKLLVEKLQQWKNFNKDHINLGPLQESNYWSTTFKYDETVETLSLIWSNINSKTSQQKKKSRQAIESIDDSSSLLMWANDYLKRKKIEDSSIFYSLIRKLNEANEFEKLEELAIKLHNILPNSTRIFNVLYSDHLSMIGLNTIIESKPRHSILQYCTNIAMKRLNKHEGISNDSTDD